MVVETSRQTGALSIGRCYGRRDEPQESWSEGLSEPICPSITSVDAMESMTIQRGKAGSIALRVSPLSDTRCLIEAA
jgi:hypothetical protein